MRMEQAQSRMVLQKITKIVCLYCGTPKANIEAVEQCVNCGAFANRVKVQTVGKGYDRLNSRRPFSEDNRQASPL